MTNAAAVAPFIAPRDLHFDLSAAKGTAWFGGDPVGTAVFNALSLTFPDGERLFMDAVRHYRCDLTGKLADDVKGFIAQEAIHAREHLALNQLIDPKRYPVDDILIMLRKRIAFGRSRGPMAMLMATIALEHFTAMLAEVHARHQDLFDQVDPAIERLWRWHALEELEHKAVAYDVFLHAARRWLPWQRYLRRCIAMAIIAHRFNHSISMFAAMLLEADGYDPREARRAVKRFLWGTPGIFGRGRRSFLDWFRPGFHPWDRDDRAILEAWGKDFAVQHGKPAAVAL
jgi:predicted metal-dependent hydrolase